MCRGSSEWSSLLSEGLCQLSILPCNFIMTGLEVRKNYNLTAFIIWESCVLQLWLLPHLHLIYMFLQLWCQMEGSWQYLDHERYILSVSLGKRRNELRRRLRACSLMAFPFWLCLFPSPLLPVSWLPLLGTMPSIITQGGQGRREILGEIWLEIGKYKIIYDSLFRIGLR